MLRFGSTIAKLWGSPQSLSTVRRELPRTFDNAKKREINRSAQVGEIHKRWSAYKREKPNNTHNVTHEDVYRYFTESMLGEMILSHNPIYEKILEKRAENLPQSIIVSPEPASITTFPLKFKKAAGTSSTPSDENSRKTNFSSTDFSDRGFYVEADMFMDEYVAGSSLDLDPSDYMVKTLESFGCEDAVERISFQQPGQKMVEVEEKVEGKCLASSNPSTSGPVTLIGTVVEEMPASSKVCSGCGANFHCKDSSLPGFVPLEVFEKIEPSRFRHETNETVHSLCKRCHLLQEHNFLINVNVCDADYSQMMSELRKQPESLVVLVVDVTDLPGSIYPKLAHIIGSRRPIIVAGNKVDLLPPDARTGYMWRFKKTVERAIEKSGLLDSFNILHTALVSAKTGYGIEELITEIYLKYTNAQLGMRGNIFLVGCTNSGKSTMFNALLQSDLCKVRAMDLVDRATTSIWPGTTISLLKFPVMKPGPYRLEMRRRRLLAHRAWTKKEMYARKLLLVETKDDRFAIPTAVIQNTYQDSEEDLQPMALKILNGEETKELKKMRRTVKVWSQDDPIFAKGRWCYDTPGTVNENQVISMFTLDELLNVTPRSVLKPRTSLLKTGESLLIGGVARIDISSISGRSNVLLTTFVNDRLPLEVLKTAEVEDYYNKWLGTQAIVVPQGDAERMRQWPGLGSGRTFEMKGRRDEGCCDIVLSSIGWVMVTSENDIVLKAFSPNSKGLTARVQPILPYSASLRGKRLPGSRFYKIQPIEFPVNVRRKKAEAKQRAGKRKNQQELDVRPDKETS